MESFWWTLKREPKGSTFKPSPKHFDLPAWESARKQSFLTHGTLEHMFDTVARLAGRALLYHDLSNGASW